MFINIFLELGLFLVFLLAILLVLFFLRAKEKKALSKKNATQSAPDLDSLVKAIESNGTSAQELKKMLELVIENYGEIDDFSPYEDILRAIVLHPHTNKNLILYFDKELSKRNPSYKKRISDVVTSTLKLR